MADQKITIRGGFFDSIDSDRPYTADEMNMPYKKVITNGVFATPLGTPSTDLQVVSAGDGMRILVRPGNAIVGDKWVENSVNYSFTAPANSNIVPRVDSVIVQVDRRQSGRNPYLVYRDGTPASNPVPPAINGVTDVYEFRLANITVAPNATAIYNDVIADQRGSEDCPWVTSLIKQVDTSALFLQWQTAYAQYFSQTTADFNEYMSEQRADWNAFIGSLVDDLTVRPELMMLTNIRVLSSATQSVPIGIPAFSRTTDILQVYVDGQIKSSIDYQISSDGQYIQFYATQEEGAEVYIVVYKSVITGDVQTVTSLISQLDQKINNFMADTSWSNFALLNGATAYSSSTTPGVRYVGKRIYVRGAIKGLTTPGSNICSVPANWRPAQPHTFTTAAILGTTAIPVVIQIKTDGYVVLLASSAAIPPTAMIPLNTCYVLE